MICVRFFSIIASLPISNDIIIPMRRAATSTLLLLPFVSLFACRQLGSYNESSPEYTTYENHSAFLISNGTKHSNIDCNTCHGTFDTFKGFTCLTADCHPQPETDAIHTSVTDYGYTSAKCYSCHFAGQGDGISREDHTLNNFPILTTDTHGNIECVSCHTNLLNMADVSCISCHEHEQPTTDSEHDGISTNAYGYKYESSQCLECHADSQVNTISGHAPSFIISSGTHGAPSRGCLDCHNKKRTDRPYSAADFTFFTCYGQCHEHSEGTTNSHHDEVGGYDPSIYITQDFSPCVSCHPNGSGGDD